MAIRIVTVPQNLPATDPSFGMNLPGDGERLPQNGEQRATQRGDVVVDVLPVRSSAVISVGDSQSVTRRERSLSTSTSSRRRRLKLRPAYLERLPKARPAPLPSAPVLQMRPSSSRPS